MNIETMKLADLVKLNAKVEALIPVARARELEAARNEFAALAKAKGFTVKDLIGSKPKRTYARRKAPTGQLRDAKGVIWAGRGRMPKGFDRKTATAVA